MAEILGFLLNLLKGGQGGAFTFPDAIEAQTQHGGIWDSI